MRPHEPIKVCLKLDAVRDWKSFFAHLRVRVTGIAGPGAPHWFEFSRRASFLHAGIPWSVELLNAVPHSSEIGPSELLNALIKFVFCSRF